MTAGAIAHAAPPGASERPRRRGRIWLRVAGVAVTTAAASILLARHLIVNVTASMPLGLYWLSPATPTALLVRGQLVAFPVPPSVRGLVDERHYLPLPPRASLLKEIVALPGDSVCTEAGVLAINGQVFGAVRESDTRGRPLPHPAFCGPLPAGQLFVASPHPQSFDSRAFGPIAEDALRGTVTPLWTR